MSHRVAITGVGIVSCLGIGADAVALALRQGKSGIVADPERVALGFRSPLTGRIAGFDSHGILPKKQRKTMPEYALQAYAAVVEAMAMAALGREAVANPQTGLIFGADSCGLGVLNAVDTLRQAGETKAIGSSTVFTAMNSTITMNLGTILGTQGANWTVSAACASGTQAIGQAVGLIASGMQERVICGAAQEINWESMCSFDAIQAFSIQTEEPQTASKPFDARRDGLVPSGGAAALVLERYDLAQRRGAEILGEVLGFGFSSDGHSMVVPTGEGLTRAIHQALGQALLDPAEIDYVCAHATSTQKGDDAEARILVELLSDGTPVSSLKSMTGHELWMAGASQAVSCVLMARHGFIAPNINLETPDPVSAKLEIPRQAIPRAPRRALCNSAGFGGTSAALVLGFGA